MRLSSILPLTALTVALAVAVAPLTAATASDRVGTYLLTVPGSAAAAHVGTVSSAGGKVTAVLENIDVLIARMPASAAQRLDSRPGWSVEAEKTFQVATTQTSPPNWGLDRIDQVDRPRDGAYTYPDTESGAGVTAYIVDTGIRRDHGEFTDRLRQGWYGYADTSGSGDCQGHGTHVAGSVGGTTVGVAKGVTLVPVVVLGCDGSGSSTVIAAGADWIVGDHAAGAPAVANMSLGGSASTAIDAAVSKMIADGITVVVAAGNSGQNACNYSPSRVAGAITVGATDSADIRASWSNFGSCLDLFAPGVSIVSADYSGAGSYSTKSGTSMASPHVAGVVARYLDAYPAASPSAVWSALSPTLTADRVASPGDGSPNRLLYAAPTGYAPSAPTGATAPEAPSNVTAGSATSSTVAVSWTAPASDGGSAISDYVVQVSAAADFATGSTVSTGSAGTSFTVTGLAPSTTYFVRVAARNAAGTSEWSAGSSATTVAAPTAPSAVTNLVATAASRTLIALTWTPPAGAILSYRLQVSTKSNFSGASTFSLSATSTSASVAGLRSATRYYVRIAAINAAGTGPWATSTAVTLR